MDKSSCASDFIGNNIMKFPVEKINLSFCKYLLGVNKNATNMAVLEELGRYPIFIDIVIKTLNYWSNLQVRRNTKPLLYECLLASEKLHMNGTKSWLTSIHKILSIFDENNTGNLKHQINITGIKKRLQTFFEAFWTISISNQVGKRGNNKLRTYCKFKCYFSAENYINQIPFNKRVNYTKFRISAHTLAIETGRHTRPVTPVERRLCRVCELDETEDEIHALIRCSKYSDKRQECFDAISKLSINFATLSDENKLVYLLNSEGNELEVSIDLVNYIFNGRRSS